MKVRRPMAGAEVRRNGAASRLISTRKSAITAGAERWGQGWRNLAELIRHTTFCTSRTGRWMRSSGEAVPVFGGADSSGASRAGANGSSPKSIAKFAGPRRDDDVGAGVVDSRTSSFGGAKIPSDSGAPVLTGGETVP